MKYSTFNRSSAALFVTAMFVAIMQARPDNKPAPADIVAKHLEAIAAADVRARIHGTQIKGTVDLTVKQGGVGQSTGRVMMASQGMQNVINLTFDSGEPTTAFAFDGSKVSVTQFRPGRHTPLEHFFAAYPDVVKEGLIGGVLSQAWPLANLAERDPKLEYAGLKKIGGTELHAIKYTPRKGSDLKILLFFEKETFRHVRTEYEQTVYSDEQKRIAGGGGTLPSVQEQRGTPQRLNVREEFSEFRLENGLMLPHRYSFELSLQSQTRPLMLEWVFALTEFSFNVPIDAKDFSVGGAF
jgi:hypothetical protein